MVKKNIQLNFFELLIEQHKRAKKQLNVLSKSPNDFDTLALLTKELKEHMSFEESHVYPVMKKKFPKEFALVVEAADTEHHQTEDLLKKLQGRSLPEENRSILISILKKNLLAHMDKEEDELFSLAHQTFSQTEIDKLSQKLADAQEGGLEESLKKVGSKIKKTVSKMAQQAGITKKGRGRPAKSANSKNTTKAQNLMVKKVIGKRGRPPKNNAA